MRNFLLLCLLVFFLVPDTRAQNPVEVKEKQPELPKDSIIQQTDTLKKKRTAYINPGKVAGRRAVFRSLIVPGLGQIGNGITVYRLAKVAGIYTGATLLTLSYIDNNRNYKLVLEELEYRAKTPPDQLDPTRLLANRQDDGLILAKDTFRRNKEVIVFSFIGLYLLNAVEAYIDARLKYFDVGDIAFKVSPGMIATDAPVYGYNQSLPGLKLTVKF